MSRTIDELVTRPIYARSMRRVLLTLLLAVALVAGGFASASAAFACPAGQPAAHSCCPGDNSSGDKPQKQDGMDCCLIGAACRTAPMPAMAEEAPWAAPAAVDVGRPLHTESAPAQGLLQEYWRPPRVL